MNTENWNMEQFDLSEEEMRESIARAERVRLRAVMKKFDAEEKKPSKGIDSKYLVIGTLILATILISVFLWYLFQKPTPAVTPLETKPGDSLEQKEQPPMAMNERSTRRYIDTVETTLSIKKENALGYATKTSKITVHQFKIKEVSPDSIMDKSHYDSLTQLVHVYRFVGTNLYLYTSSGERSEVYEIDKKFYLKLNGTFYSLNPTSSSAALRTVTDKGILNRLEKIDFLQGN